MSKAEEGAAEVAVVPPRQRPRRSILVPIGAVMFALGIFLPPKIPAFRAWLQVNGFELSRLYAALAADILGVCGLFSLALLLIGAIRNHRWAKEDAAKSAASSERPA